LRKDNSSRRTPTIRDVAQAAGVSLKTVSRVINGDKGVSAETRKRVLAAIEALGYRPNALARSLRGRKTYTIGVIITDITNGFFSTIVRGIEDEAFARNYSVLVANSDELLEKEKLYVRIFVEKQVDGLIIVPATGSQEYLRDLASHIPLVFVDRPPRDFSGPVVQVENREGAYRLTRHLLEHGFERLAFLASDLRLPTVQERFAGFRKAMDEAGIVLHPEMVKDGAKTIHEAHRKTHELFVLPLRPQAIFAANNLVVQGVLKAIRERNLRIPQDVAVVGFDDFEMADLVQPRLTVVAQPAYALGKEAAVLLFSRMTCPSLAGETVVLPVEVVLRGSCGCEDAPQEEMFLKGVRSST